MAFGFARFYNEATHKIWAYCGESLPELEAISDARTSDTWPKQ